MMGDSLATGSVSANLPHASSSEGIQIRENSDFKDALRIVDDVLTSQGYIKNSQPLAPKDQERGLVALYGGCSVSINGDTLTIGFAEFHAHHLSSRARKTRNLLAKKLGDRFGAGGVTIEN